MVVVSYGRSVDVLWQRFLRQCGEGDVTMEEAVCWLRRRDFGWVCGDPACWKVAGVLYKTADVAKGSAERHAAEHAQPATATPWSPVTPPEQWPPDGAQR